MTQVSEFKAQIQTLKRELNRTRHGLAQGELADVQALTREMQGLSARVASLPPDQARPVLHDLVGLFDELSRLGDEMSAQRDRLKGELEKLSVNHRAAHAYGGGTGR